MRLTIHLPDGDLTLDFTPRDVDNPPEEPPMVDQKPAAQVEMSYQGDGGAVQALGFRALPGPLR